MERENRLTFIYKHSLIDQILIQQQTEWLSSLIIAMFVMAGLTGLLTRLQLQNLRRMKVKLSIHGHVWAVHSAFASFTDQLLCPALLWRNQ
jgi:ATP-binding cassette, subfamily C, bacterial